MSEISLILVLHLKTNKIQNDMAKVRIKSKKLTPFGGIFAIIAVCQTTSGVQVESVQYDASHGSSLFLHLEISYHPRKWTHSNM